MQKVLVMIRTVVVVLQGIVLVSPGIDGERNLILSILEKLQGIALVICPNARIVPSPPLDKCINVPELVSHSSPLLSLKTLLDSVWQLPRAHQKG